MVACDSQVVPTGTSHGGILNRLDGSALRANINFGVKAVPHVQHCLGYLSRFSHRMVGQPGSFALSIFLNVVEGNSRSVVHTDSPSCQVGRHPHWNISQVLWVDKVSRT